MDEAFLEGIARPRIEDELKDPRFHGDERGKLPEAEDLLESLRLEVEMARGT